MTTGNKLHENMGIEFAQHRGFSVVSIQERFCELNVIQIMSEILKVGCRVGD